MDESRRRYQRLRDCIQPGVLVLFVGINPGLRSAQTGHHFAGHSNRFWKLLHESELVSEPLTYREDGRLPEWRLGLTNIISRCTAGIDGLDPVEYRQGVVNLKRKIQRYQPHIVALLGVTIFRMLFSPKKHEKGPLDLGVTTRQLGGARIFLLPNPSGRNAHYSYRQMLMVFRVLRGNMEQFHKKHAPSTIVAHGSGNSSDSVFQVLQEAGFHSWNKPANRAIFRVASRVCCPNQEHRYPCCSNAKRG